MLAALISQLRKELDGRGSLLEEVLRVQHVQHWVAPRGTLISVGQPHENGEDIRLAEATARMTPEERRISNENIRKWAEQFRESVLVGGAVRTAKAARLSRRAIDEAPDRR